MFGARLWTGHRHIAVAETQSLLSQAHCPVGEQTSSQAGTGAWYEKKGSGELGAAGEGFSTEGAETKPVESEAHPHPGAACLNWSWKVSWLLRGENFHLEAL